MALDQDQVQGLAGFRLALRQFLAASETISRQAGVTQQQYQALLAIRAWPGPEMQIGDLAQDLLLSHHATVQLVDRLEKAGLVRRAPSATDGRSVLVFLTPAGQGLFDALAVRHLHEMQIQEPLLSLSLRRLRGLQRA